jgi:hypothetical protein
MLNRVTEPRIILVVDEFYHLSLYVLKKLLSQVKLETSLGTFQPSVSWIDCEREPARMKSSEE